LVFSQSSIASSISKWETTPSLTTRAKHLEQTPIPKPDKTMMLVLNRSQTSWLHHSLWNLPMSSAKPRVRASSSSPSLSIRI
jgi:hypothetical protein